MRATTIKALAAAGAAVALAPVATATAQPRSSELRCTVAGGFGYVVEGQRAANCVYYRADGMVEFYVGSSSRFGIDFGPTNAQRLAFKVQAADPTQPAALNGNFAGVAVGATLGEGLSTQGLLGGATGQVVLVPIDLPNYTGQNIAAGLGVLNLRYAGREPHAVHERY